MGEKERARACTHTDSEGCATRAGGWASKQTAGPLCSSLFHTMRLPPREASLTLAAAMLGPGRLHVQEERGEEHEAKKGESSSLRVAGWKREGRATGRKAALEAKGQGKRVQI